MVWTSGSIPSSNAVLILFLVESWEDADMPERETNVSRGMDSTFAVPAAGSTWTILMVSLR